MSLKAFHLVFVTAAIGLSLGCAVWGFRDYASSQGGVGDLLFGLGSVMVGAALVIYERIFLKKLKGIQDL